MQESNTKNQPARHVRTKTRQAGNKDLIQVHDRLIRIWLEL